ncbi:unnamed protein product [Paramecium octaurelia]|uniref:DM10 domain-containing protein n=1 Tax=Paramecium octaurelia TaxID=43137 RepID=A0A8S1WZG5_PAROT|nr:unnamed protein product [Paramecium octaurelia]
MASAFPKLPGFVPTQEIDKPNFRKVSSTKQEQNREVNHLPNKEYAVPRKQPIQIPPQTGMFNPDYMSTTHAMHLPKNVNNDSEELYQPSWVKMDRHVLRFSGYFKEAVVESALENYRIRKITICYYLEDHSLSITEPKQENSGVPQGAFLKRQKVLRADDSKTFILPEDFRINQDIIIFGKTIRLYDCDQYTREFYELQGIPQEASFVPQSDSFETKTMTKFIPQKDTVMKDYLEHKLGGGRVTSQKQFLENDRKVLKFYVFSDIEYILHYYLADDTIEIKEINSANSGRVPFPMMLRRQKLPRKFSLNQPGQTYAEDFIRPQDIQFGQPLIIYNRKFFINGCDQFTRYYYFEKFNVDFPLGGQEEQVQQERSNIIIPPHNGIGDEQDSLGYIYRLQPIPPKKDFFKWVDNQVNLRFLAMFNTTKPEDKDRVFVITFFLNDDSLLVYEPTVRNSGIPDGKFLEKRKYKNVNNNNEFFTPNDLIVGNEVVINGWKFQLLDCDEFTKKWYAQNFK